MSRTISTRLTALEAEEWRHAHALPPREWFRQGYIRIDRLDPPERTELAELLERLWDDHGGMVPEQLTLSERQRVSDLVGMIAERIP